ncbi:chorismate synthase [Heyndrickxia camelliae]|uniref:Chorismate synthase n=1 Tax=Heyndrickxia camelliae TaxID=1707093 RepID=A0A2N3LDI7_9BACI|nr:chorismate synthase [Heyndrickxia camelliae]PKR82666.1 chorismate synthase [Heyndrickxia camelliae]
MSLFDWFKTGSEIKRDEYHKLYEKLSDAINEHDRKVSDAESAYHSYISTIPNLSNTKIPSNDFDTKREELDDKLIRYFDADKDKRSALVSAKNKAYERYIYYKNLVIKEEAERKAKEEKELKERMERLNGKR